MSFEKANKMMALVCCLISPPSARTSRGSEQSLSCLSINSGRRVISFSSHLPHLPFSGWPLTQTILRPLISHSSINGFDSILLASTICWHYCCLPSRVDVIKLAVNEIIIYKFVSYRHKSLCADNIPRRSDIICFQRELCQISIKVFKSSIDRITAELDKGG